MNQMKTERRLQDPDLQGYQKADQGQISEAPPQGRLPAAQALFTHRKDEKAKEATVWEETAPPKERLP